MNRAVGLTLISIMSLIAAENVAWFSAAPGQKACFYSRVSTATTAPFAFTASVSYKSTVYTDTTGPTLHIVMELVAEASTCPANTTSNTSTSYTLTGGDTDIIGVTPASATTFKIDGGKHVTNGVATVPTSTQNIILLLNYASGVGSCNVHVGTTSSKQAAQAAWQAGQAAQAGTSFPVYNSTALGLIYTIGNPSYVSSDPHSLSFWCGGNLTAEWSGNVNDYQCGGSSVKFALVGVSGNTTTPPEVAIFKGKNNCSPSSGLMGDGKPQASSWFVWAMALGVAAVLM